MQPTEGLKALKCSFSEGWAFLKCQKSWKRQLAPLPAARAKQPALNMAESCLCSPHGAGGWGFLRRSPYKLPCVPPSCCTADGLAGPNAMQCQSVTFLPPATVQTRRNLRAISSCFQRMPTKQPFPQNTCATPQSPSHTSAMVIISIEQQICTVVQDHPMVPGGPCTKGVSMLQHEHGLASTS